jgi:hypothetical protein
VFIHTQVIRSMPRGRLVLAAAIACALVIALGANASPANAATTYYGSNQCQGFRWFVDNAGAEACLRQNWKSATGISFTPGAYDYAKDGYSALNDTIVYQWVPGRGWIFSTSRQVLVTTGVGSSRIGDAFGVQRAPGATHIGFRLRACTYNTPTSARISCGAEWHQYHWDS